MADLSQIQWTPVPDGYRLTRWLACFKLLAGDVTAQCGQVLKALERHLIEARPVWKPMHLQPQPLVKSAPEFAHEVGHDVPAQMFQAGSCLPSASDLSQAAQARVFVRLHHVLTRGQERHAIA